MAASRYGENIVFLVGCSRSGTTWLQRLLSCHPRIKTGQESFLFCRYIGPQIRAWKGELSRESDAATASGRGGVGLSCYVEEAQFMEALEAYANELLSHVIGNIDPGGLFLEKTPQHSLYLPEIKMLLPEARIIHLIRDPRDVVASLIAASRSWASSWAPGSVTKALNFWKRHVDAVRGSRASFSTRAFIEIRYEDLWYRPQESLAGLMDFLGLTWSSQAIQAAIQQCSLESLRSGRAPQLLLRGEMANQGHTRAVDPPGFARSGVPGSWRKDLNLWQRTSVSWALRHSLHEYGYA